MGVVLPRTAAPQRAEPLVRRLARFGPVTAAEAALLEEAAAHAEEHRPGAELMPARGGAGRAKLILSGWACRQRLLRDGRRQILSLLLPGDLILFGVPGSPISEASTVALTRLETIDLPAPAPAAASAGSALAKLLQATPAIEERQLIDHLVRLGRHTAYERLGHLLLELCERLGAVGLTDNGRFPLPVTQETLADALGLSVVHVNRILQQFRREGLIEAHGGYVSLPAPGALAAAVDYTRQGAAA
jgi:CRP-like cAMP-binding protein